jgi:hypothetical protein
MTQEEAIEILEEIARDPDCYPTSRVKAIRTLLQLDKERESEPSVFSDLDAVPLVRPRARRAN